MPDSSLPPSRPAAAPRSQSPPCTGLGVGVGKPSRLSPAEVLALAAALKRENPARTAAQVGRILHAQSGWAPSERTLQHHFEAFEQNTRPDGDPPEAFGRFEAARLNTPAMPAVIDTAMLTQRGAGHLHQFHDRGSCQCKLTLRRELVLTRS